MVSAFVAENRLILGQLKCKNKRHELETIQRLPKVLDIEGAIVTIDAAGCHKVVVEQIRNQGGDCLIALKENQGNLQAEAINYVSNLKADAEKLGKAARNHGSIENNLHWQLDVTYREDLSRVRKGNGAKNLSVVRRAN